MTTGERRIVKNQRADSRNVNASPPQFVTTVMPAPIRFDSPAFSIVFAIPSAAGVLLLATLAACSNSPEQGSMGDFLTATVSNGATFNPANPTARVVGPVELAISGTDTVSAVPRQVIIDWYGTVSVGTFQLAAQALSYASYFETHGDSIYEWTSALNGATGTLTFTAVSSTRDAGKFTFT
jgi:hypothetical protein